MEWFPSLFHSILGIETSLPVLFLFIATVADLSQIQAFVLDEVDCLLHMGFELQVVPGSLPSMENSFTCCEYHHFVTGSKNWRVFATRETEPDVLSHYSSSNWKDGLWDDGQPPIHLCWRGNHTKHIKSPPYFHLSHIPCFPSRVHRVSLWSILLSGWRRVPRKRDSLPSSVMKNCSSEQPLQLLDPGYIYICHVSSVCCQASRCGLCELKDGHSSSSWCNQ